METLVLNSVNLLKIGEFRSHYFCLVFSRILGLLVLVFSLCRLECGLGQWSNTCLASAMSPSLHLTRSSQLTHYFALILDSGFVFVFVSNVA